MWLVYLYFIRDALIELYDLGEDVFEWALTGAEQPYTATVARFLDTLQDYGIVAAANGGILIAWALYNRFRFRGVDRHLAGAPVSVADLAELYKLPAQDIASWQRSRILVMQHDPDGTLARVIAKDPG